MRPISRLMKISRGNISQAAKLAGEHRADLCALLENDNLNPSISDRAEGICLQAKSLFRPAIRDIRQVDCMIIHSTF